MSLRFNSKKEELVYKALDSLCEALELRGESGTEKVFYILVEAFDKDNVVEMQAVLDESHDDGLCYNMLWEITERIMQISEGYTDG